MKLAGSIPQHASNRLQHVRRLDEHNRPASRAGEHRRQQPKLANAGLRREQFDQRAGWPSTARQSIHQLRVARVDAACARARQLAGTPETGMDGFRAGEGGVHGVGVT
nr:hypothetical protein [Burkholderia stagnalis]